MKMLKTLFLLFSVSTGFSCSQKMAVQPADTLDAQVIGSWKLIRIVNGFSQFSQTPEEAGYSETVEYRSDGTYQRLHLAKSDQQEDKGRFTTGPNPTKTADKNAIFYPDDQTVQPYSLRDGHLFLYQRGSQGGTIADGSTYQYQRQ